MHETLHTYNIDKKDFMNQFVYSFCDYEINFEIVKQ